MDFPHIRIVLVEPQGPMNIGSVCRVMKNFGFNDLRLVKPRVDHLHKQARDMAVSAKDTILKQATVCDSLQDALLGCNYVIGTSTRHGKYRQEFIQPEQLSQVRSELGESMTMALVFGPEDHGLKTSDLDCCDRFVTIRTSDALHSLNLAQAVTICLYELSKDNGIEKLQEGRENAPFEEVDAMLEHMKQSLNTANYLNPQNPEHIIHTYRRIFARADLDRREVITLHGLWSRIEYLSQFMPDEN